MDKETKERLREIRAALKKYGFDKILGQSAKNKIQLGSKLTEVVVHLRLLILY